MLKLISLMTVAAMALSGCGASGSSDPGRQELALATGALDQQLNAPAEAMRSALASANADKHIFPSELVISDASSQTTVDWWLYDHGYIRVGGVEAYQGYFVLTPKGEAWLEGGPPRWLVSSFKGQPDVVCSGSQMFMSCRVTANATVAAAPDAKELIADPSVVPPQSFQVVLQKGTDGWSASDFASSTTPAPAESGRRALFGDPKAIGRARARYAEEVNKQVH